MHNSDPLKPHFYIVKLGFTGVYIIFLISAQNIDCGYSLEPHRRSGSNEYPQSIFWAEMWKISEFFIWKSSFFLVLKFSVYLNRRVFVMESNTGSPKTRMRALIWAFAVRLKEEANWSGSALFVIKYVNLYQQSWSSSLIGWQNHWTFYKTINGEQKMPGWDYAHARDVSECAFRACMKTPFRLARPILSLKRLLLEIKASC